MDDLSFIVLPAAIGLISLGIGLQLKFADFKRIFTQPRAILAGLFCQIIMLPVIALIIIYFWPIPPIYKVGFLLIAGCPGGTMSNFVNYVLKGRVALSVSLTAFNSAVILISIPLIIKFATFIFTGSEMGIHLSFGHTIGDIFISVVLPVFIGIIIHEKTPDSFSQKLDRPMRIVTTMLLLIMAVVVLWFSDEKPLNDIFENLHLLVPLLVLNISTILTGYYIPGLLKVDHTSRYTIAIEVGLQNSALAIYIAGQLMNNAQIALIAILYGSFSLFTTWLAGYLLKRYGISQNL